MLHGTITKPVATQQYFLQNLKQLTKAEILFWQLFTKAQYYFGNYLQKPNTILATSFWHLLKKQKKEKRKKKKEKRKPKTIGQKIILPKPKCYLVKELYYA